MNIKSTFKTGTQEYRKNLRGYESLYLFLGDRIGN